VKVANAEAPKRPAVGPSGDEDGFRLYDSLYETALKQDIPKPLIDTLVRVFGNDVDFQRSVAGGDSFDAFYTDGDDDSGRTDLLYAAITVRNETFRYYRFVTPDDNAVDFYDENGRSVRKFLMRSPVPNAVVTSGFGLRFHPILGYSRPHTGVDWAAPIGTPILAAGSGTVLKAERSSSYGNHVEIQHANGYITTYSHMTGFARGIADGVRVRQGQVVGYLGQTGLATGPHLHYEVIVNGHFVDPMRVKLARTREMDGKVLADFKHERDRIDTLMAGAPNAVATTPEKHAEN
jgi:murein DD-endopeptidase MepM/ murein hydrolase activator NlpD